MNRFVDAHAPRGRVASRAPRRAPLEPAPLPNRLRHVRVRAPCPRLNTPRNAPRLEDCRRPPDRPPQSQPTFVAATRGGDLWVSSTVRTHAQMHAELESLRVRVPYTARCNLPATTLLRTAAHIQYRRCYRSAFGHRPPRTGTGTGWSRRGTTGPIPPPPSARRNRTLRGGAMNRIAARNGHGTIPCGVPSPPGESPNLASEPMMAKRYPAVPFRHRTPAPGNPNHVCRQHEQLRCRRPVSRAKMGAVAASSVDFTDGMIDRHKNYSRHHHSPLRTGRTPTASDPLSNSSVQETSLGPTTAGKNLQTNSPAAQSTVLDVLGSPHQRSSPDRTVVYGYGAPMEPGRWTQP